MTFASMKRLPRRWSLSTLLLVFSILAISASHLRVSWLLSETQRQAAWLESRREMTSWPKPDAVNVLLLHPQSKALDSDAQQAHWTWRLQLPPDKLYRLHAESSTSLAPFDPSGTQEPPNLSDPILLRGQSELSVTVRKSRKGRLSVAWGNQHFSIPDGGELFALQGSTAKYAGLNGIANSEAANALELVSVRSTRSAAGFRIWIEPVSFTSESENRRESRP